MNVNILRIEFTITWQHRSCKAHYTQNSTFSYINDDEIHVQCPSMGKWVFGDNALTRWLAPAHPFSECAYCNELYSSKEKQH